MTLLPALFSCLSVLSVSRHGLREGLAHSLSHQGFSSPCWEAPSSKFHGRGSVWASWDQGSTSSSVDVAMGKDHDPLSQRGERLSKGRGQDGRISRNS